MESATERQSCLVEDALTTSMLQVCVPSSVAAAYVSVTAAEAPLTVKPREVALASLSGIPLQAEKGN